MFRLLVQDPSTAHQVNRSEFQDLPDARDEAKQFCRKYGGVVLVTQDVARVEMAPVVDVLTETPTPPPGPVYRNAGLKSQVALELELEEDSPKVAVIRSMADSSRRLLVVDRRATPAELVGHMMVVAEGKIVKNAFGALELGDMPLTGAELAEVTAALR